MLEHGVNRLPVIEDGKRFGEIESGHLVGIVTHRDLVRAFARSDQIAEEIRERIDGELSIPPGRVRFFVKGGEVTLEGNVEWFTSAELLVDQIKRIPGVVAVDSQLTWREKAPELGSPMGLVV